jgi:hypothetical protein
MTSKDKTRQKLVGSMRKTKAVAGIGPDTANTESVDEDLKPTVKAKPVSATNAERGVPAKTKARVVDAYQSGRRVWPD